MVTQAKTIYGMDEREQEKQVRGIKTVPYYDRRGGEYGSAEEVAVPLSVEEIETLGKALQQWAPRVDLLADLGKALGVETGQAEKQMLKVLHFRLVHAAHMLDPERFPDPVGTLADQPQEEPTTPTNREIEESMRRPDPDSVTGIDVPEEEQVALDAESGAASQEAEEEIESRG